LRISEGQAPEKFTRRYIKDLGFHYSNFHALIPLLKGLGFLSSDGVPTARYHAYRDQSQATSIASALANPDGRQYQNANLDECHLAAVTIARLARRCVRSGVRSTMQQLWSESIDHARSLSKLANNGFEPILDNILEVQAGTILLQPCPPRPS
jgi:hypothetical protein